MKKMVTLCLLAALLCGLYGCGHAEQPEACGHEAYLDLIARLEAEDYDGARSLIDMMEGHTVSEEPSEAPTEASAAQEETGVPEQQPEAAAVPEVTVPQAGTVVELTKENVRDYFVFTEEYFISDQSECTQYITLKEEYKDRLLSLEGVKLEVSYLLCKAYGKIDLEAEEFRLEYYDGISREKETRTIEPDQSGMGWISPMLDYSRKGYFPDFAMDVEIESGSGKLIFAEE